jgi:thiamine kinase-like enzyme
MHDTIIKKQLSTYFNVSEDKIVVLDRLKGGMSNSNYIVKVQERLYTFRIPGKNAFVFVDREVERTMLDLIKPLHIDGNALLHLEVDTGYKISNYIEGTPLMQLEPGDFYKEVADVLHKLHDSGLKARNDYAPFKRLQHYEELVINEGLSHQEDYFESKNRLLAYKDLLCKTPKVFCHNDSQPSNFIKSSRKELYLVDWEFGGNNDVFYDVSCYGNIDFNYALGLLPYYLGREPLIEETRRVYLWRVFQCLQWHNVALYKEAIGLSAELHLDFKMIASNYIKKANLLFAAMLEL